MKTNINGRDKEGETKMESIWQEYDAAATWCAKRGIKGRYGDQLPANLSAECTNLITNDIEAFEDRVNDTAYALAMNKHE